jgi:hypothetical protein
MYSEPCMWKYLLVKMWLSTKEEEMYVYAYDYIYDDQYWDVSYWITHSRSSDKQVNNIIRVDNMIRFFSLKNINIHTRK